MSVGIVGLPNVGKSTLFNAILKRQVAYVANYPFATIEPNVGVVEVPDFRVDKLAELSKSEKKVYSTITFIDIAGLVKGASTGAGLGNKFLSHIREVDLILLLLRDFEDENIVREGSKDPESDAEVLLTELKLKDIETLGKSGNTGSGKGLIRVSPDSGETRIQTVGKALTALNQNKLLLDVSWTKEEFEILNQFLLLTMKPILKVHNVAEENLNRDNPALNAGLSLLSQIPKVSAKLEFELSSLSERDQKEYLEGLGLAESPLNAVIKKAYEMLNLRTFLTTGIKESRAWKFVEGWNAQKCAGVIHSDFERLFIASDIVPYEKLITAGSLVNAREKGWVRLEGKEYMMKDGDVVEFRVGRG